MSDEGTGMKYVSIRFNNVGYVLAGIHIALLLAIILIANPKVLQRCRIPLKTESTTMHRVLEQKQNLKSINGLGCHQFVKHQVI